CARHYYGSSYPFAYW
nr:immunoglobulin heavy chain junction region [Mus musculus]